MPNLDETVFSVIPGAARVGRILNRFEGFIRRDDNRVIRPTQEAPRTTFNGKVTAHRRFVFGQLPLERVKALKKAHGVTVNDVIVAICAGAVRQWLTRSRRAAPGAARRSGAGLGTYEGAGGHLRQPHPHARRGIAHRDRRPRRTPEADLRRPHRHEGPPQSAAGAAAFGREQLHPARAVQPGGAADALARQLSVAHPTWNLVVSNVPGPQFDLYCAGAKLLANYPVSVITDGLGLNITVMSYAGHLDVGILADREQMPDLWKLIDWLKDSLDELEKATFD